MILFTILMIVLMVEQNCQLNSIYKDDIGLIIEVWCGWDYDDFNALPIMLSVIVLAALNSKITSES